MYIMYLVCKDLKYNRRKIINNLTSAVESVLFSECESDKTELNAKSDELTKKHKGLIELYTSDEISKEEFTELRQKYSTEINSIKSVLDGMEVQQSMKNHRELISDIKKSIDELINGVQYEDEFYSQILDRMVVHDKNHIDVYLNMLPYKWSFAVEKNAISETHLPISVRIPFTSS